MGSDRRRAMRYAPEASAGRVHWFGLPGPAGLATMMALALLAFGAVALPGPARAAGGTIQIISPLYGGVAEGPVGAEVNLQGANWPPNTQVDLNAADVHGDTSGLTGSACVNNSVTLFTLGEATSDGSGNIATTILWSASAGFAGHSYWVCGTANTITTPGVSAYKVLSGSAPSVAINVSQAAAGSNITVTGQNWLPANQQIQVTIAPSITGQPPYSSTATTTPGSNGSISVSVQVPTAASAGTTLYVSAQNLGSNNPGSLHTQPTNTPQFTVTAQPTPTPTPTTTPSPTPTNAPSATSVAGNGGGSNGGANGSGGSGSSSGGASSLAILLVVLVVILLAAAGVAVLLFVRSRRPAPGTAGSGGTPYGRSGGYPPQGGYGPPGGAGRTSRPQRPGGWGNAGAPGQGGGWGNAGGWQGNAQGPEPDDPDGDGPTVGMSNPWR